MKLPILFAICGCIFVGASSDLVLVVDQSDTVYTDTFKQSVSQFFLEQKTNFTNYALVLFNETNIYKTLSNKDATSFFKTSLTSQGGNSRRRGARPVCKGVSLTGILNGLQSIAPKSIVLVFTDAIPTAEDSQLLANITRNIAATRSKVIFILTKGNCGDPQSEEYRNITAASNGLIFNVKQNETLTVLQGIKSSIGPQRVDLLAADEQIEAATDRNFEISLSNKTVSNVLVTVSANNNFTVRITDPQNSEIRCTNVAYQAICPIQKLVGGKYTINVDNIGSTYALRVSATSNLAFSYGFENLENNSTNAKQIFSQPLTDTNNTLVVKFDPPSAIKSLTNVTIVTANGTKSKSYIMSNSSVDVYYTLFKPPSAHFHLQLNGTTADGTVFQLITPVALHPSTGNETDNFIVKEMQYVSRETLMNKTPSKGNSAKSVNSSSSFVMATVAALFFVVKTATSN